MVKQMRMDKFTAPISAVVTSTIWLLSPAAQANPLFSIGEGGQQSWTDAFNSGVIRAVDPFKGDTLTGAAQAFYTSQVGFGEFALVPSVITPDVNVTFTPDTFSSLVMQWNPPVGGENLAVAGWEYVYGVDPDLTGTTINFSLGVPEELDQFGNPTGLPAIWDLSVELIDVNGNARGWFLSMPAIGWSFHRIIVNQGAQTGFQFFEDPGFDITQVTTIRLDEAGMMVNFPAAPPGSQPGYWDWNAWNSLSVTPAPGTLALLTLGGLFAKRRRRR